MALQRWLIVTMSAAITVFVLAGVSVRAQEVFSFIELDENTDPRFSMQHRTGDIGIIKPAGKKVFVNSQNIRQHMALRSNDHVRTRSKSAVRIEFFDGQSDCQIAVSDFLDGNLYGDNGKCTHEVTTSHATAHTSSSDTKYHISVSAKETEITVLTGVVSATLGTDTASAVTINAGNDAVVTSKGIKGPNTVSDKKIQKRTKWRQRYDFETGKAKGKTLLRDIAIGVGTAIILKKVYDKNKKKRKTDPPDKNGDGRPDKNGDSGNTPGAEPDTNRPTIPPTNGPDDSDSYDIELF